MFKRISVIGGDLRQLTAAKLLKKDGYEVVLYGFEQSEDAVCETDIKRALNADAVILPMPVSFDGEFLNAPFGGRKYKMKEIADGLNVAAVVFGGQMKPEFVQELEMRGIKYCDYLNREELAIKNAVPTAFVIWVWILWVSFIKNTDRIGCQFCRYTLTTFRYFLSCQIVI